MPRKRRSHTHTLSRLFYTPNNRPSDRLTRTCFSGIRFADTYQQLAIDVSWMLYDDVFSDLYRWARSQQTTHSIGCMWKHSWRIPMRQRVSFYRLPVELWFYVHGGYWSYPIKCWKFYLQTFHISFNLRVYRHTHTHASCISKYILLPTKCPTFVFSTHLPFPLSHLFVLLIHQKYQFQWLANCKLQCMHVKIIKIRIKFHGIGGFCFFFNVLHIQLLEKDTKIICAWNFDISLNFRCLTANCNQFVQFSI